MRRAVPEVIHSTMGQSSPEARAERFARFCAARAEGKSTAEAAIAAGVAVKTAGKYEAERRQQRGAS